MLDFINNLPSNVIVANPEKLAEKLNSFNVATLTIMADFDQTLSKYHAQGSTQKQSGGMGIMLRSPHFPQRFTHVANALRDYYYPIERDPGHHDKEKAMEEWWTLMLLTLMDMGMTRSDVYEACKDQHLELRPNLSTFLDIAKKNNIPVHIVSAGLKQVVINVLKINNLWYDDIQVTANDLVFENDVDWQQVAETSKSWKEAHEARLHSFFPHHHAEPSRPGEPLVGFRLPIIHVMNKSVVVPHLDDVLLLGDSMGDLLMGKHAKNVISVGYLSHNAAQLLDIYKKDWDIVVLNDGGMEAPLAILNHLVTK